MVNAGKETSVIPQLLIVIPGHFFNAGNVSVDKDGELLISSLYFKVSNKGTDSELIWEAAKASALISKGKESVPIPETLIPDVLLNEAVCSAGNVTEESEPAFAVMVMPEVV